MSALTVPSLQAVPRASPLGKNLTALTSLSWMSNFITHWPLRASHTRAVRSQPWRRGQGTYTGQNSDHIVVSNQAVSLHQRQTLWKDPLDELRAFGREEGTGKNETTGMRLLEWDYWNETTGMRLLEWYHWNETAGMRLLEWDYWNETTGMIPLEWDYWNETAENETTENETTRMRLLRMRLLEWDCWE